MVLIYYHAYSCGVDGRLVPDLELVEYEEVWLLGYLENVCWASWETNIPNFPNWLPCFSFSQSALLCVLINTYIVKNFNLLFFQVDI